MSAFDLGIIIANYNTCGLLRECLRSVYANHGVSLETCVVDNASPDGSADMVAAEFPQARLIRSKTNGGFAYANNLGLAAWGLGERRALGVESSANDGAPRYVLLLNSDTVTPTDGLAQMVQFMDNHPEAGVAGPKLVLLDGRLDLACRRGFPTPEASAYHFTGLSKRFPASPRFARYNLTYLDPNQLAEVDSVNGAFMMVRAQAIRQAGGLDEAFFFGGEDLDWAYRIKAAGWKVYYNPAVIVRHVKRASYRQNPQARYEFERAMWIFYRKHYQAATSPLLNVLICLGLALRGGPRLVREMFGNSDSKPGRISGGKA